MTYRPKPITGRTGPQPGYATGGVVSAQPTRLFGERCEPFPMELLKLWREQRALGAEFEAVWEANLKELYEP